MNNYHKSIHIRRILRIVSVILAACLVLEVSVFAAYAMSPKRRYTHALDLGSKYLLSLDYEDAVKAFSKAIDIDPKKPDAYIGRGDAYAALNMDEQARDDYEYAISLDAAYREELLPKIEKLTPAESIAAPEPTAVPVQTATPIPTATPAPTATPEPTNTPTPTTPPALYVPPINGTGGGDYGGTYLGTSGEEYSFNLYTSNDDPNNPGVVYTPTPPSRETAYEMWTVETDVHRLDKQIGDRTLYAVFDTRDGNLICNIYENGALIDECVRIRRPVAG